MIKRINFGQVLGLIIVILTFAVLASVAQAADPKDVAEVVKIMRSDSKKGIIERKRHDDSSVRIVFVDKGLRYTMYYSGPTEDQFLSIWVRRNGTGDKDNLETFSDHGLDGIVDFGIGPNQQMYFIGPDQLLEATGEDFRGFWQIMYDEAIKAALKRLK